MATPPASRDDFEIALVCSLSLEYDAITLLFDQFWDENGDQYGRAIGDLNTYTTGRFGKFDVVLVLLPNTGTVSASSATASLRSSYPGLRLVILAGICGAVPSSGAGDEILLGDVIISKAVLGRPDKNIRSLVAVLETARERARIEERAAAFLEQIQDLAATKTRRFKADTYQYPGAASDKLFEPTYRHKHYNSPQCLCEKCHEYSDPVCEESRDLACDVLGCDDAHAISRQRLEKNRQLEQQGRSKDAQIPSVFIGRFGSNDRLFQSGEHRDWIAKRYGILAFEMEGAGVWDELPCIIVKGVCNYADSHMNNLWQNFAAATAASVAKSLVERYTRTDKSAMIQIQKQMEEMMENKESSECLKDLHQTDPRDDKTRIQRTKGDLLKDSYRWVLGHNDFKQWRDNPQYRLLWIKGDPGKGKTMLLCGIIDEIESSTTMHCLSYFFCQATEVRLRNATAVLRGLIYMIVIQRPLLISHVREKYDSSGKKLFDDSNAWEALSKILMAILKDARLTDAILIVDALDECVEELPRLLNFLSQASSSSRAKWIVSSRNWPVIEENLDTAMQGVRLCLELNETSVSAAVQAYIKHKIQELTEKKGYDATTQHAVEQHLMSNAHGTFLWVALVCQELGDAKVKKRHTLGKLKTSYPPGLDTLYQRMMENIRDSLDADICRQILAIVSVVYRPLTLAELGQLLDSHDDYENDDLLDIIESCGSFLTIRDDVVYLIHQSAKDFLLDKATDKILASGVGHQHHIIFSRSLDILTKTLQRDIYNLRFPGFPIEQVSRLDTDPLAPAAYSCIYWIDHFSDSKCLQALSLEERTQTEDTIAEFFGRKYLYWLEALSLLRDMSNRLLAIQKLKENIQTPQLAQLLKDAHRFFLSNKRAIESTPLQVYATALIFSPLQSRVRELFVAEEPEWILAKPRVKTHWPASSTILEGHANKIRAIAISHDSSIIASGSYDRTIRLWQTSTGDCTHELKGHKEVITCIAFSHDAAILASGSDDHTVRLWRTDTGNCLHKLVGHTLPVQLVTFSCNSVFIASASGGATIRLWRVDSGNCVRTLRDGRPMAFSPDSSLLASVSRDDIIRFWRVETGDCEREVQLNLPALEPATVDHPIQIWRIDTGECVRTLRCQGYNQHFGYFQHFAFSQNSDIFASASDDGMVRLWRLDTGDCVRALKLDSGLDNFAFSRDFSLVAASGANKTIRLFPIDVNNDVQEAEAQSDMQEQNIFQAWNTWIVFSQDSTLVASTSERSKIVSLWCTRTGRRIRELQGHSKEMKSIAFSHDSLLLASASGGETFRIWSTDTGECLRELHHGPKINAVAFSHDSVLVASISWGEIRLWSTDTGDCVQVLHICTEDRMDLFGMSAAFSHNSTLLASGNSEGDVQIWSVARGANVQTLRGLEDPVTSITFSQDSTLVAAAAGGGAARLWRVDTGECLQSTHLGVKSNFAPHNLSISSNHSRLLTEFGSIAIDSTETADTQIPAHYVGIGVGCDYSWITWNNHNILRLPAELGACHSAISGSTIAIVCASGQVVFIRLSTEKLSNLYDGADYNGIA